MNNIFFEKAIKQILKLEDDYANHPQDPGGETNYGITKAVARANGYQGDMEKLPLNTAIQIYKKEYWQKLPEINNFNISFLLFDFSVNSGVKQSIKHLQNALNTFLIKSIDYKPLVIDGIVGEKTKNAIKEIENAAIFNNTKIKELEITLINERLKFYTNLQQFNVFGKGWINRIIKNIDFLSKNNV